MPSKNSKSGWNKKMDTRVFHYPDRLLTVAAGGLPPPVHVFLDTTRDCTQRCWYRYERQGAGLGY